MEIRIGNDHIAFEVRTPHRATVFAHRLPFQTAKIGSLVDIQDSEDPEGLRVFYYLVQDLKARHPRPLFPRVRELNHLTVSHLLLDLTALQNQTHMIIS